MLLLKDSVVFCCFETILVLSIRSSLLSLFLFPCCGLQAVLKKQAFDDLNPLAFAAYNRVVQPGTFVRVTGTAGRARTLGELLVVRNPVITPYLTMLLHGILNVKLR